ncbi:MAG: hypothetical protein OHK0044_06900 [Burkholderiaceae bacterium]
MLDPARYRIRTSPAPLRWRRRIIALGSGDPTRAMCWTLIAQAFQPMRYPILPEVSLEKLDDPNCRDRELLHVRHHSLFAPRDFDVSPFFAAVTPRIEAGSDDRALAWADRHAAGAKERPRVFGGTATGNRTVIRRRAVRRVRAKRSGH